MPIDSLFAGSFGPLEGSPPRFPHLTRWMEAGHPPSEAWESTPHTVVDRFLDGGALAADAAPVTIAVEDHELVAPHEVSLGLSIHDSLYDRKPQIRKGWHLGYLDTTLCEIDIVG